MYNELIIFTNIDGKGIVGWKNNGRGNVWDGKKMGELFEVA